MSSGAVCRVMSPPFPCVVGANAEAVPQEGKLKDMNPLIAFHVRRVFQLRNLTFPELPDIKKKQKTCCILYNNPAFFLPVEQSMINDFVHYLCCVSPVDIS